MNVYAEVWRKREYSFGGMEERMEKKRIAVLFGGCSPEYGVSLESAHSVMTHMDRRKYEVFPVGITKTGGWYAYEGDWGRILQDEWFSRERCKRAALLPDRNEDGRGRFLVFRENGTEETAIDAVFPVLHGRNGEDGTVQGLCELAGVPVAGCTMIASALGMDKDRAHRLAASAGVSVPESVVVRKQEFMEGKSVMPPDFPVFVKPVRAGSSFGITKVTSQEGICAALEKAFSYDDEAIVEQAVPGFEVGCAVMGNERLITGAVDEIELKDGFFDYAEKYGLVTSKIHVPARISGQKAREIQKTAKKIYRALGCRGFARVDMFLTPEGKVVFNEVNTIPGFTAHSRFPGMMRAAGWPLEAVVDQAIGLALGAEAADAGEGEGAWALEDG